MPELPEVETVKEVLKPKLVSLGIKEVLVHHEKMIKNVEVADFKGKLIGQRFINIHRRGKYLIFELDDYHLLSHLRMEGKFFYGESKSVRNKHVHVEFVLLNGEYLRYEDVRKFGTFHLYEKEINLEETHVFSVLGPEPWEDRFNVDHVIAFFKGKKMPIKSMLLSQKVVTGLGNIYVDEVLFASNVHPMKKSCDLTRIEIENVVHYTKEILSQAIVHKGTTIRTFSSEHGSGGKFQNFLQVHTKKDEPCPRCNTLILKTKVGGRGTYFCAVCQPRRIKIIGITGGIATGKSYVSKFLQKLGYELIDADVVVRELQSLGSPILAKIVAEFGEQVLCTDGHLDREALGQIVFNDIDARHRLEGIMHPAVRSEFERLISESKSDVLFLDVPLLFEAGFDDLTTFNLVINATRVNQLQRLMKRDGLSEQQAQARIDSQMPMSEKIARGDFVIDNDGDFYELEEKVEQFLKEIV